MSLIGGSRSSSRLTQKANEDNHKTDRGSVSSGHRGIDIQQKTSPSTVVTEKIISKSLNDSKQHQSNANINIHTNTNINNNTTTINTPATLRTTTSRRGGGRAGHNIFPRAALKKNSLSQNQQHQHQHQPPQPHSGTPLQIQNSEKMRGKKKEMNGSGSVLASTPSSAAQAAAAAAKALCGDPNRGGYGMDPYSRGYYNDDRQNVFRTRGKDESTGRITTRSKNGIRKPKAPYGNSIVRVMGSHTPTHISRPNYDRDESTSKSTASTSFHSGSRGGGNTSSVFRERRTHSFDPQSGPDWSFKSLEATPQQLLLSLKSGSKSFDLPHPPAKTVTSFPRSPSKEDGEKDKATSPLSPAAPPQIQHSHHQAMKSDSFFFDSRAKAPMTPKANGTKNTNTDGLQGTPSFSLFNQSFDSFGDGYLRSPNGSNGGFDQTLRGSFSQASDSPRKKSFSKSFSASPTLNGFSFSPQKQKHHAGLNSFEGDSPSMDIDNIADVMETPLLPRSQKSPTDPLLGPNIMVLESRKAVRNKIPAPNVSDESPRKKSSSVPFKKRHTPVRLERRPPHDTFRPVMRAGPPPGSDQRMPPRMAPYPPPIPRHLKDSPPKIHPAARVHAIRTNSIPLRPPPASYPRPHPPPIYRQTRPPTDIYMPKREKTSLSALSLDQIYERLGSHKMAFEKCSYLLPGFKRAIMDAESGSTPVSMKTESGTVVTVSPERTDGARDANEKNEIPEIDKEKDKHDRIIAKRRVVSAICAFGGNTTKSATKETNDSTNDDKYSSTIATRYFEHENRISWDVEDNPPVESPKHAQLARNADGLTPDKRRDPFHDLKSPKRAKIELAGKSQVDGKKLNPGETPKMRYRCKLCGQPKQNHKCPYQKSLQRSIGVNVYAAVNAFTAAEPGNLAPALSDMNNFVSLSEITPIRPKRTGIIPPHPQSHHPAPHVTPDAMRSMTPRGPPSGFPVSGMTPYGQYAFGGRMMPQTPNRNIRRRHILSPAAKNASHGIHQHGADLVFMDLIPLRPEQFRYVSTKVHSSFEYPAIPVPYSQRKALSDNLFELSKELPLLKEECAVMLRQAREANMWDMAVAELLSQLIVAIHCPVEDKRLEGLSRYLNSLGFAC